MKNYYQSMLNVLIKLHLEILLFLFLVTFCQRQITCIFFMYRYLFYFIKFLVHQSKLRLNLFTVYISFIFFIFSWFSTNWSLNANSEAENADSNYYSKYQFYFIVISSGFLSGCITYFVCNKTVNFVADTALAQEDLLTPEKKKVLSECRNLPVKLDLFCLSFFIGSSVAYVISKYINA